MYWLVLTGTNFGVAGAAADLQVWVGGVELPGVVMVREHTRVQVRCINHSASVVSISLYLPCE
jgi:hypothetical protein